MSSENAGRVALVTGSTQGIGKAIAEHLAGEGFTLAYHSKSSVAAGRKLAGGHANASYTQADLADQSEASGLIAQVLSHHGRLDVLVNNAGISATIPHADLGAASPETWHALYAVNVIAPWTLITAAEQALRSSSTKECSSCVVNISSHAGVRPKGASIPYSVSKAALNHMTKLLAVSLSPDIRVNAVAPGLVDTQMTASWVAAQKLWRERAPMKRAAQPEDIAQIVSMLVASNYLTGEVVLADGGLNLI